MTFQYKGSLIRKKLTSLPGAEPRAPRDGRVNKLTLPARAEVIVQVPVNAGPRVQEGLVERAELMPGVYMAESLVKVNNGSIVTSLINTTAVDVHLLDYVVKLEEIDEIDARNTDETTFLGAMRQGKDDQNLSRGERVIAKLSDEHLN